MRDLVTGRSSWWRLGRFGAIAAWAVSVGCVSGCLQPDTIVLVTVESTLPLDDVHQLHVTLKLGEKTRVLDIPQRPVPITLPTSFTVQLGRSLGGRLDVTVEARDGAGAMLASASRSIADLTQGHENTVTIDLTGGAGGTDGGTDGVPADGSVDLPALDAGGDLVGGSGGSGGVPAGSGGAVGSGGSAGNAPGAGGGGGGRAGSPSGGGGGAGRVGSGGVMGSGGAVGTGGAAAGANGAGGGGRAGSDGAGAGTSGAAAGGGSSPGDGASGGGVRVGGP